MGGLKLDAQLKNAGVDAGRSNIYHVDPEALILVEDPNHDLYDPRVVMGVDQDFLEDIQKHGILNPVQITRDGNNPDGSPRLLVVAGRRRVTHARELKKQGTTIRVPCSQVRGSFQEMMLRAISENAHREDETYYTKAYKIRKALELGATRDECRKAARCSPNTLILLLDFMDLHPEAQKIVMGRNLPIGSVEALSKVPRDKQVETLGKIDKIEKVKKRDVDAAAVVTNGGEPPAPVLRMVPKKKIQRYTEEIAESLAEEGDSVELQAQLRLIKFLQGDETALIKGRDVIPSWVMV